MAERAGETSQLEGVEARTGEREGFLSETVHILDERGSRLWQTGGHLCDADHGRPAAAGRRTPSGGAARAVAGVLRN